MSASYLQGKGSGRKQGTDDRIDWKRKPCINIEKYAVCRHRKLWSTRRDGARGPSPEGQCADTN